MRTASDGDLWPSCWADDGALYSANGDGAGFAAEPWFDLAVNRIIGEPLTGLYGERLSGGEEVCPLWADAACYNRKPTGMLAVDGNQDGCDELYLAVQMLSHFHGSIPAFDDAPVAGIACSLDYGRTWSAANAPMFEDHVFTTVMFLDAGQSGRHLNDCDSRGVRYAYAYGIDQNWRTSFTRQVPDPDSLYLARVPIDRIMVREAWEFFSGDEGAPCWTGEIEQRVPVLVDRRRVGAGRGGPRDDGYGVVAQGGVVFNAPLRRYLYTSWSEYSFEFFEAPAPWGPWRPLLSHDFGPYPWGGWAHGDQTPQCGGYAPTIPSKFISDDGLAMWVQANWFAGQATRENTYHFSLRRLTVLPHANKPD